MFALSLLSSLFQGIEQNPIIVAVLAALALPGATSLVVSVIRKASDALSVDPRVIVYVASLGITGLLVANGVTPFPALGGDPSAMVGEWIVWGTANAELARRVYELLLSKLGAATA